MQEKKDVFINFPTGFGKSVIFQALPVQYASLKANHAKIVIVVCPLVTLMKDQVSLSLSLGVRAIALNSDTSETERRNIE